jgi:hypothetical protein
MKYIQELYKELEDEFYFEKIVEDGEGLEQSWEDTQVWCNPTEVDVKELYKWVSKAYRNNALVAILLPVIKDSTWYNKFILRNEHIDIRPLSKKIKFNGDSYKAMIVIFYPE